MRRCEARWQDGFSLSCRTPPLPSPTLVPSSTVRCVMRTHNQTHVTHHTHTHTDRITARTIFIQTMSVTPRRLGRTRCCTQIVFGQSSKTCWEKNRLRTVDACVRGPTKTRHACLIPFRIENTHTHGKNNVPFAGFHDQPWGQSRSAGQCCEETCSVSSTICNVLSQKTLHYARNFSFHNTYA